MPSQSRNATAEPPATDPSRPLLDAADETGGTGSAAPLTAALLHVARHGLSFATPGHRGGRSCSARSTDARAVMLPEQSVLAEGARLLRGAFQLDQSTSVTDLGSLFVPTGDRPVQRLKRNLAEAYGMAWSFPSTHGTTMLNILALLTACPAGGRVLVNRDAHSSVTAALIHGGLEPVYPSRPTIAISASRSVPRWRMSMRCLPPAGTSTASSSPRRLFRYRRPARGRDRHGARPRPASRGRCRPCAALPLLRRAASGGRRSGGGPGDAIDAQGRDCAVAGQPAAVAERESRLKCCTSR